MRAYAEFMQEQFIHGIFIVADFPKKYNIMAFEGVSEKEAERRATIAGDGLRNGLEKITRDYPFVKVARWKHFMTSDYEHNLQILHQEFEKCVLFHDEVNTIANAFAENNKHRWSSSEKPSIAILKEYVLDEVAFLLAVPCSFSTPVCEVYPCEFPLQSKVKARAFPFSNQLQFREDSRFMGAHYEHSHS
jgi:tRNA-dependent cyclodipeptide synthase